jgi:acyl carrier protein
MELNEILSEVNKIFIDLFEDKNIVLTEKSDTNEIEAWDSLNHIKVITSIENHFNIRFELDELLNYQNIGDICLGIYSKIN